MKKTTIIISLAALGTALSTAAFSNEEKTGFYYDGDIYVSYEDFPGTDITTLQGHTNFGFNPGGIGGSFNPSTFGFDVGFLGYAFDSGTGGTDDAYAFYPAVTFTWSFGRTFVGRPEDAMAIYDHASDYRLPGYFGFLLDNVISASSAGRLITLLDDDFNGLGIRHDTQIADTKVSYSYFNYDDANTFAIAGETKLNAYTYVYGGYQRIMPDSSPNESIYMLGTRGKVRNFSWLLQGSKSSLTDTKKYDAMFDYQINQNLNGGLDLFYSDAGADGIDAATISLEYNVADRFSIGISHTNSSEDTLNGVYSIFLGKSF